jgi:hypothetical protein
MNKEEILDYNRRCADFLGWEITGPGFPAGYWNDKDFIQFHELKFHSDWNWIHEVIEAIEKLEFRFEIAYNQVDLECMRPDLNRFSYHINLHDCEGYGNDLQLTKKEAVVKAINQFLIWYNENKTN